METQGLSSICAGLGCVEEDGDGNRIGYTKGEYCSDNLKDLLRFLRRDDPQNREVFKQVCKWNIVSKYLMPLMENFQEDRSLVLNAVKVLVFLTMPVDPASSDIPQQIEYLWQVKSAITSCDAVAIIVSLLETPLENLESNAFTEDDWKLVQLILTLFRNLLSVQEISVHQKAVGSASQILSLRDRFLELLFKEKVMDIFVVISQHMDGSCGFLLQDNWLLLEIFYYIFKGQDPELISKPNVGDTKASLDNLKSIIDEEKDKRRLSRVQTAGRYSQYGAFARLSMDGSKTVLNGNPTSSHDFLKKSDKSNCSKTKKIVGENPCIPVMKGNILKLLHDFLNDFLAGGYNALMQSIREDIERDHVTVQKSDVVTFFEVAKFVTSFQYHKFLTSKPDLVAESSIACSDSCEDTAFFKGNMCGPIATTMNEAMFSLLISRWRDTFEGLKETNGFKFLSAAGSLLKAKIRLLDLVLKLLPEDSREPQTARILLYKLFYDQTDQGMTHFLLNLIKAFDAQKQPKSDLADLAEMIHIIVRLMEMLQDRGTLRVSKKMRKRRKKKSSNDKKEMEMEPTVNRTTTAVGIDLYNEEKSAIGDACEKDDPSSARFTCEGEANFPLGADASEIHNTAGIEPENDTATVSNIEPSSHPTDTYDNASDSSGDDQLCEYNEVDFNVSSLISAFANSSIIHNLCWLLKFYKNNSPRTNHYIISMLRRISDDLELSPMLYQISLLTTFYEILAEQKSCGSKNYEEIVNFLTDLVRKMMRKMKHQPLLFVEVLFWKTRRECQCINVEHLLHEVNNIKKQNGSKVPTIIPSGGKAGPTGWIRRSIADALGDDEADVVIDHDIGHDINEISHDDSPEITKFSNSEDFNGKEDLSSGGSAGHEVSNGTKRKRRLVLTHELEAKISDLYEKFKDDQNCSNLIAEALDPDGKVSPAQVVNKLKQLGLKISRRKRAHGHGKSPNELTPPGEGTAEEREDASLEMTDPSKPLHKRKRVSALSQDQELMIKSLYEKFKDNRRCSYMIANALDGENTFTSAQISRKLKQLGLQAPRKKSENSIPLVDEIHSDYSNDEAHESDNETLLSFKQRRQSRSSKLHLQQIQNSSVKEKLEDDSDEEILSLLLKKSRKLPSEGKTEKMENVGGTSSTGAPVDKFHEDIAVEAEATERDEENQSFDEQANEDKETTGLNSLYHASKDPIGGDVSNDLNNLGTNNTKDLQFAVVDDELADSGDDVQSGAFAERIANRRRMRMVLDLDDDNVE